MDKSKINTEKEIVPPPLIGEQTGAQVDKYLKSVEEAKSVFRKAKKRLFNINKWHEYAGAGSAKFILTDNLGDEIHRNPEIGDFIKIDLPGPGPVEGDGFDWVEIEAIEEKKEDIDEYAALRVRPAPNPKKRNDDKIAHFHAGTATSTFIVQRRGLVVSAAEKGRNELQNKENLGLFDKIRNILVSFTASKGAANPQWKALMEGFLE